MDPIVLRLIPAALVQHLEPDARIEAPASHVLEALRKARSMVAGGWSEPFTVDNAGRWVSPFDEAPARFSVHDALLLGAPTLEAQIVAGSALWVTMSPSLHPTLETWLEAPGRKLPEVLALFDRACARVSAIARTERAAA